MLRALLLAVLTVFATASCSKKADAPDVAVGAAAGKVVELTGKVEATREGKTRELALGGEVFRDDQIATSADATVTIELFHNGAKWAVVSNKKARVDSSLAWGLDKQEAAKTVEHNSAAAGRNAERSAADTASTTDMKEQAKPGAMPATESAPAVAAPQAPPTTGAASPVGGSPPPPPPPPPAPKIEKKGASPSRNRSADLGVAEKQTTRTESAPAPGPTATSASAPSKSSTSAPKDMPPPDTKEADESSDKVAVVISPQTLAERQRPALQKCTDKASKVTVTIDVRKNTTKTTVKGTNVTDKTRSCIDAIVQKIEWPVPGTTFQVVLKLD